MSIFRGAAFWRALLLTASLVGLALCVFEPYLDVRGARTRSISDMVLTSANGAGLQTIARVEPGSPAARAGLHSGQRIDIRLMTPAQRYELYNPTYRGKPLTLYVGGPSGFKPIQIAAVPYNPLRWDVTIAFAGLAWMLLFAAVLALRRPDDRGVQTLAAALIGIAFNSLLLPGNFLTPWAWLDASMSALSFAFLVAIALLATYALDFARPPSAMRRALTYGAYAIACVCALIGMAGVSTQWFGIWDPSRISSANSTVSSLPFLLPLVCGVAAAARTRGVERSRFLWAFVPLAPAYAIEFLDNPAIPFPMGVGYAIHVAGNIFAFIAPLGLTYSLLSRRVLDVGFALNRATVFSAVSLTLVGAFVIVEWALSEWMDGIGHVANFAVGGALALVLGLSVRFVHGKVEQVVDNVMFRKRREDEEAIRKTAREAPYITDPATLLARAQRVLLQHADSSSVSILLDDGHGFYATISENDPALVSLRADHARVDLHALETSIDGEWAYPMVSRGRLVGALVLGPKRSQESYAPDESAAVTQLAHSIAGALDVLSTRAPDDALAGIRASLDTLNTAIAQMPAAIARELRATPVE